MSQEMGQGEILDILLVEDDPSDVSLIKEALSESEVANRVHVAKNGEQAIDFLLRKSEFDDVPRPHVVILDLSMPRKNGHEVLAEIRAEEDLKDLPVVILTTSTNPDDREAACLENKADFFFNKSLDPEVFRNLVKPVGGFLSQFVLRK